LPKKVTDKEKEKIISGFISGQSVDILSKKFNISKITITRHLKKNIEEKKYKDLLKKNNDKKIDFEIVNKILVPNNLDEEKIKEKTFNEKNSFSEESFFEITPLDCDIDDQRQKDLSSIPISNAELPKIVYMVVDKKIELEVKYLNDYPDWQFLSKDELSRKTIEIFYDLKIAKRFCNKEQKVIKVPNTNIFRIVAPILNSRGITRIISGEQLIAL